MAKKCLLVLALAAFVAGGVFAESLFSVGGGLMFDGGRIGSVSEGGGTGRLNAYGFGAYAFADATFAELSLGLMAGRSSYGESAGAFSSSITGSFFAIDISALGKLPIMLESGNITAFPLAGIGYTAMLSVGGDLGALLDLDPDASASHFNTFRLQFGGGADFDVSDSMFVRASLLGAWRFAPRFARDAAALSSGASAHGGFGVTAKVGIGFRL